MLTCQLFQTHLLPPSHNSPSLPLIPMAEPQLLLEVPFDVTLLPEKLHVHDAADQNLALQAALFAPQSDAHNTENFANQPRMSKPLGFFKRLYDQEQEHIAINMLSKRVEINLCDSDMRVSPQSPDIAWNPDATFMDLRICVGNGPGLGAVLPNQSVNHNFELRLNLNQAYRTFSPKFAKLGFDPTGCMLLIGRSPASEDVWLALAPKVSLRTACEDVPAGTCAGSTQMSKRHHRMTVMFIAQMLKRIVYRDVTVSNNYPDLDDPEGGEPYYWQTNAM